MRKAYVACLMLCWGYTWPLLAQTGDSTQFSVPPIGWLRAEESYRFVDTLAEQQLFLQALKWIPLSRDHGVFLTLGGEYRARVESFWNKNYRPENEAYYSQRLSFHASLRLGARLRLFGELYHGLTSGKDRLLEDDRIDLHQGFLEVRLHQSAAASTFLRLGRQELGFGISRLVGIREGPNMRRAFDLIRLTHTFKHQSVDLLYGKELTDGFGAFDNTSYLFRDQGPSPLLWGLYLTDKKVGRVGNLEGYYLGFKSPVARFNDVSGEELRHSLGLRSYGQIGRFSFNTELVYQFGRLAQSDISAYNFETDWKYRLAEKGWKPQLGLRLDFSSGDARAGDGKVQTFNPLFVNPAIYSLAAVNTPANLTSFHPNLTVYPAPGFSIYLDYARFYRSSINDGLYTPPRFILRPANGETARQIGDVIGIQVQYAFNRNLSFDLRSSYFLAGKFIQATGDAEPLFYLAPTLSAKF